MGFVFGWVGSLAGNWGSGKLTIVGGMLKPWFGSQCWRLGPKGTRLLCRAGGRGCLWMRD
jgi:hypothetical protein